MSKVLKDTYAKLNRQAEKLVADLSSGGFDASLEWHFQPDEGYPLPCVVVAGYGRLTLCISGWRYGFMLSKRKALKFSFSHIAASYGLTVYGYDFPEDVMCENSDRVDDVAFAVAASREAFINVTLAGGGNADVLVFRKILAEIERSMHDNDNQ